MPSQLETMSSQYASQLKRYNTQVSKLILTKPLDQTALARLGHDYATQTAPDIDKILGEIAALQSAHTTVENFYFYHLLHEAARYNQFFNVIESITGDAHQYCVITPTESFHDTMLAANFTPILHPLLDSYAPTRMRVVLKKRDDENVFREHYLDDDYRKFYNKKTSPTGKPHQDLDHYYKANVNIGGATQKSNLQRLFKSSFSQPKDDYFKPADAEKHSIERTLFASAMQHIQSGNTLSTDEERVLTHGEYYRHPRPQQFKLSAENSESRHHTVTHIGHASELIEMEGRSHLMVAVDPVNYQSGTEGIIVKWGASIGYPRKTAAAIKTDAYPSTQVVLITHNHHDHMCFQSMQEAFSPLTTLFIVPLGDARRMRAQGFENVIEFSSWNDYAEITLTNHRNEVTTFIINSFPAKHASNRFTNDLFKSLYMGFMLRHAQSHELVLCTGDTGVLDQEHFEQLEKYLETNNLMIRTACIASGPDRPRRWMACTHQSTADAITMHARFTMMNVRSMAKQRQLSVDRLPMDAILDGGVRAVGYHQGCFRLGLLSLHDVRTTVLRMLAVISTLPRFSAAEISLRDLQRNTFYHFMDRFEQIALQETLSAYDELRQLTTQDIAALISHLFFIPKPGQNTALLHNKQITLPFEYEQLIQNRNPLAAHAQTFNRPYEFFALSTDPQLYREGTLDPHALIQSLFEAYLERTLSMTSGKQQKLRDFLVAIPCIDKKDCGYAIGKLYADMFPQQDEGVRDEGHVSTMLTILAGLLHFRDFREKFRARHMEMQQQQYSAVAHLTR